MNRPDDADEGAPADREVTGTPSAAENADPEPGGVELSGTLAALTADDLDQSERRRLLGRLAAEFRARGIADLFRPRAAMRWVADAVSDIAPRLPIREAHT